METETKTETIEEENVNWLKDELKEVEESSTFTGEKLPALELPINKNTKFEVDASKPFQKWIDPVDKTVKKIIPVSQGENRFVLWINVKNPLYKQILDKLVSGQTKFNVFRTGEKQNTRYTLVED